MSKNIDQQIVRDLRSFDFMAQRIWPHIRGLFKGSVAARCERFTLARQRSESTNP